MSAVARLLLARGLPGQRLRRRRQPHAGSRCATAVPASTSATTRRTSPTSTPWWCRRRSATTTSSSPPPAPRGCGCCTAPRPSRRSWAARAASRSPAPTARPRRPRCSSSPSSRPAPTPRSPRVARSRSSAPTPRSVTARPSSSRPTRATAPSSPTAPTSPSSPTCSPTTSTSTARSRRSRRPTPRFVESVTDGGLLVACHDDDGSRRLADAARAAGRTVRHLRVRARAPTCGSARSARTGLGTRSVFVHDGVEQRARPRRAGRAQRHGRLRRLPRRRRRARRRPRRPCSPGSPGSRGARRRFEVRGEVDGVTVVDDYAHNPAKVAAVVGTASEIVRRAGHGSLRVVFQPHLYSRTRDFADRVRPGAGARPTRSCCSTSTARASSRSRASPRRWSATRCEPCPGGARCSSGRPATRPSRRWPAPPGPATSCSPSVPATSPPSPRCSLDALHARTGGETR